MTGCVGTFVPVVGAKGATGNTGATGATGSAGVPGPQGPAGLTYRGTWSATTTYVQTDSVSYAGSSYLAIAGNTGQQPDITATTWALLAKAGSTGATGSTGSTGSLGLTGQQGATGATGPAGPQGAVGITFRGAWSASTAYAATDSVAYSGSTYLALATSIGSQPDSASANWALLAKAGVAGAMGNTGATGVTGPQGIAGPIGPQGATGPAGINGAVGAQGSAGPTGAQGATGAAGTNGAAGAQGPAGPAGPQGATGTQGPAGLTFQGAWSATSTYSPFDAVTFAGSTYLASVTNSNVQPDLSPATWSLLAKSGEAGAAGATGATGTSGLPGTAATVTLGTVSTLPAGSAVSITNSGNSAAAILNFALPQGAPGSLVGASTITSPLLRALGSINLFDASKVVANVTLNPDGSTSATNSIYNIHTSDFTLCSGLSQITFSGNTGFVLAFYDSNQTFLEYLTPTSTTVAVPTGAYYFRFSNNNSLSTVMVVAGATLPSTYIPYGALDAAVVEAVAKVPSTLGPLAGKNLGILGDSITAIYGGTWMPTVQTRTNATFVYNDSLGGRGAQLAFVDYGNGAATPYDGSGTNAAGHTLAQDLANVDLMLIEFGTNDGPLYLHSNLGSPTDPPDMSPNATYSSTIAGVIETLLKYKPTLRIVWMTPWQDNPNNGNAGCTSLACSNAIVNTIVTTCANYGVPVINLMTESGIGPATWSTYLADGVHPSAVGGQKVIGPLVGQKLNLYF